VQPEFEALGAMIEPSSAKKMNVNVAKMTLVTTEP
jgi:hypothetical protein